MPTSKIEQPSKPAPSTPVTIARAPAPASAPAPTENTTDATRGEPLAVRAKARKAELQKALDRLPVSELRARNDIELALGSVDELLTGDSAHPSDATAAALNRWLEGSKHLAESTPKPRH